MLPFINFQNIRTHDRIDFILSLLPNLMVGLRHIWTMSNYYCYDDKMEELLRKISFVFVEKVKDIITLNNIFNHSSKEAYDLATDSAKLLLAWRKTYMDTRTFIEQSRVGSRWEFDKKLLFQDVEHCARISQDIANIAEVSQSCAKGVRQYYFFFYLYRSSLNLKIYSDID